MLVFNDLRILRSDFVAHGMGGWLRLVSWHLHGISARDVPGVTDVLQLAGWQQLTEVRLFCSRFRMRFFDSKDGIGDSRNRDEPENIRDSSFPGVIHHRDTESTKFSLGLPETHSQAIRRPCGMQYAKLERYSIALCMIRRIFLFGFWRPENVFSAGKQRVLRPAGLEIARANFFLSNSLTERHARFNCG